MPKNHKCCSSAGNRDDSALVCEAITFLLQKTNSRCSPACILPNWFSKSDPPAARKRDSFLNKISYALAALLCGFCLLFFPDRPCPGKHRPCLVDHGVTTPVKTEWLAHFIRNTLGSLTGTVILCLLPGICGWHDNVAARWPFVRNVAVC